MRTNADEETVIAEWLETQRGRRQYRAAPHAGKVVGRIMQPLSRKHGGGHTGLAQNWADIVGERFAKISKPVRFAGGREGRTLVIEAPGAAAALIMASGSQIIDKVNAVMGPDHIRHIKVRQTKIKVDAKPATSKRGLTPSEDNNLQSDLAKIGDDELKTALEKLGRTVIARETK